jgi:hypothetical protein
MDEQETSGTAKLFGLPTRTDNDAGNGTDDILLEIEHPKIYLRTLTSARIVTWTTCTVNRRPHETPYRRFGR